MLDASHLLKDDNWEICAPTGLGGILDLFFFYGCSFPPPSRRSVFHYASPGYDLDSRSDMWRTFLLPLVIPSDREDVWSDMWRTCVHHTSSSESVDIPSNREFVSLRLSF